MTRDSGPRRDARFGCLGVGGARGAEWSRASSAKARVDVGRASLSIRESADAHPGPDIGGRPGGLSLAVELGRRGISCLIVEPRVAVSRARPRCKTINVRTMEHLRRWGIADRLRAAAHLPPSFSQDVVFCTTLVGRELSRFTGVLGLSADPELCPEVGQQAPQYVIEETLREVVAELPACDLALGARVIGLDEHDGGVEVMVDTSEGRVEVEAEYVVGCDGSRSTVRAAIGAEYVGDVALRPNLGVVFRPPFSGSTCDTGLPSITG